MNDWTPPTPLGEDGDASYMLELTSRRPAWQAQAACRGASADIFYSEIWHEQQAARALCAQCPVRHECLEAGLSEDYGMWGGTSQRERLRIKRARKYAA